MPDENTPKLTHAIHSTGKDTVPLAGGRSRYTANGVPILELRHDLALKVSEHARRAVDPDQETEYLVREIVHLENANPQAGYDNSPVVVNIGGETLDEAAKSVVGVYEAVFGTQPPKWVASTHQDLAEVVADHFGDCEVRSLLND